MSVCFPDPVVRRLPMYYRYLKRLENEGTAFVTSTALAEMTGLTASQVRQDVNTFGGAGRQGSGYPVSEMREYIGKLLGIDKQQTMAIIGMGNLGRAIAGYEPFSQTSFTAVAAFDADPQKTGRRVGNLVVRSVEEIENFLAHTHVDIAVLTLPAACAQEMSCRLYECGIRGFWNFAPVDLQLPRAAAVVNVHLDASLEQLSYRLTNPGIW